MKIAYLHGLESSNTGRKVEWLNENFDTYAPKIDYRDDNTFDKLLKGCKGADLIVGSSMGGYFAYLIGSKLGIKTILFNPAVVDRPFDPVVDDSKLKSTKHNVYLGKKDKTVDGEKVMRYFGHTGSGSFYYTEYDGGHRVHYGIFVESISTILKLGENTEIYNLNKIYNLMDNQINKMKTFEAFVGESDSVSTEDKYKVADKLNECYTEAIEEAKEWADDVHDNHTVVSYMEENAALVAALAVKALKECKDHTPEQLEGALNTLKDSYSKKIEEMKEMEGAEIVESVKMYSQEEINEAFVNAGTSQEGISSFMSSLTKSI